MAAALGTTTRNIRRMVAAGQLVPVPGTGGQGRPARFSAAAVQAADVAGAFARAVAAFRQGALPAQALDCFLPWYEARDGSGRLYRAHHRNDLTRIFPATTPADATAARIAGGLSQAEVRYLLAALCAAAHPQAARYNAPPATRAQVIRPRAGGPVPWRVRWLARMDFEVWPRVLALIKARPHAEKRSVSDSALLDYMATCTGRVPRRYKGQLALAKQASAIARAAGASRSDIQRYARARMASVARAVGVPAPAAVARVLCVQRAQGARLWRGIRGKLAVADLTWLEDLFNKSPRAAPPVPAPLWEITVGGQTFKALVRHVTRS